MCRCNKLTITDLWAIDECLGAYKCLLEWLPITTDVEEDLKEDKFKTIEHLTIKINNLLEEDEKENG